MSSLYAVGSGLDIPTIVSQLVAADRAPTENRINAQGTAATAKLSALGTIKSALTNLQSSLKALQEGVSTPTWSTTVEEGAGFTASSSTAANPGSYSLEVQQLATLHKLSSPAFQADEKPGAGTLSIDVDGKTLEITVAADMGLSSLAREINRVADGKGVTASVITSDQGQHLVLTATKTGSDGRITLSSTPAAADPDNPVPAGRLSELTTSPAAGSTGMNEVTIPQDARVLIDGQVRTGSSNTFTDLIEGMTITLTKAETEPGKASKLTVSADSTLVKTNIQAFVSTYNAVLNTLKSSSSYNAETQQASTLTGDSMVRGLQNQLRALIGGNNVADLKALGLTTSKDGTLTFNAANFDKSRSESPGLAESVLGKTGRVSQGMQTLLTNNLDANTGMLTQRTDSLNKQIKRLEKDLDDLDVRMERAYERYTKQFTAMDSLVASMQSTSNYLTQQLASLAAQTGQ